MRTGNSNRWMFGKLLGLTLATLSLTAITHAATLKKIVAVSSFENKTTWRGQVDLGDGMADQLTDALMQSGQFTVMERQQLGAVVAEQDLANSGRAQKSQSAQTGKLVNAQILIKGTVTEFQENSSGSAKRGLTVSNVMGSLMLYSPWYGSLRPASGSGKLSAR